MRRTILCGALLLAACGGGDSDSHQATSTTQAAAETSPSVTSTTITQVPPEPTPPSPGAVDPAVMFAGLLDDDGRLDIAGATALFAATFAPLPGVQPAAVPALDHDSMVLGVLSAHLDQLGDEHRDVIERIIGAPPAVQGFAASPESTPPGTRATVEHAISFFEDKLGISVDVPVVIVGLPYANADGTTNFSGPGVGASAIGQYRGDRYDHCLIRINLDTPRGGSTTTAELGHEVFHCFQKRWHDADHPPLWILEGQAAFAGNDYGGDSSYTDGWWRGWIDRPERDLLSRTYDAVGLFELANAHGVSPYAFAARLVGEPTIEQFRSSVGDPTIDDWPLHFANEADWGPAYTVRGVAAPVRRAPRQSAEIALGGAPTIRFPPGPSDRAATVADVTIATDVVVVRIAPTNTAGRARFSDGSEFDFTRAVDVCVLPDGCDCPDETPAHVDAPSESLFVGLGGDLGDDLPSLNGLDFDTWCPDPPNPCEPADPTATVPSECDPPPLGGECYHGEWVADPAQVAAHAEETLRASTQGAGAYESGNIVLTIRDDGTYSQRFEDLTIGGSTPEGYIRYTSNQRIDGRYDIDGSTLSITAETIHFSDLITIGGEGTTVTSDLDLPTSDTARIELECGGNTLSFSTFGSFPTEFTRRR